MREFRPYQAREGVFDRFMNTAILFGAGMALTIIVLGVLFVATLLVLMTAAPGVLSAAAGRLPGEVLGALYIGSTLFGAVAFVRWQHRVVRERRLVIDDEGLTYCTALRGCRSLRWGEIESVEEDWASGVDWSTATLRIRGRGRRIKFDDSAFADYGAIRTLVRQRIPERVRLHPEYGLTG